MRADKGQEHATAPRPGPIVSVVICTLNRAEVLEGALQSLADQTAPAGSFEVLVMDNGSTDHTAEVAERFGKVLDLRYLREARTGLSYARNAGYVEASGAYVAYLDDDATARPDWVESILAAVEKESPDVLGGPVIPFFPAGRPAWFPPESQAWSLGDRMRELHRDEYIRGESIVIKKSALERLGGFRTDLGMKGNALGYGEETELQCRLRRTSAAARITYSPDVVVYHLVRPEKLTLGWQLQRCWIQGRQAGAIYDAEAFSARRFPRLHALGKGAGHGILAIFTALAAPFRSRRSYPYWRTYVMLRVLPHVYSFGAHSSFALARRRAEVG